MLKARLVFNLLRDFGPLFLDTSHNEFGNSFEGKNRLLAKSHLKAII